MIVDRVPAEATAWDICIVGSGPVGLSLAFECEELGLKVIVLESGSSSVSARLKEASLASIQNPSTHAPMDVAVCRALGGTSWTWGGRCVPFDDIDFASRPHVPHSQWPITHRDIRPWYSQAARYLLCGTDTFQLQCPAAAGLGPTVSASSLERWSTESRIALVHRERMVRSKLLTFCLNSTVIDIQFDASGKAVEGVIAATNEGHSVVRSKHVVLAAGGVETTRLLLAIQKKWPGHFGGTNGPLGRFYMGHIAGKIASVTLNDPAFINELDFKLDATGAYIRRRLTIEPQTQQENKILNTVFWADNPTFYNASHKSGVLSAVFLALAFPPSGRRLLPEGIRLIHTGPKPYQYRDHLRNVILDAPGSIGNIVSILRHRFLANPRKPGFLIRNRGMEYALHYHAEQQPNRESRITLTDERDSFGLARASIDLRFTEEDAQSVIRSHEILDAALRAGTIGRLKYWYPASELLPRVKAQASDGFHQVGTTRMGTNPDDSVVDADLRVHGTANLHVASSSVFPTSGQANSTFLAAALAVRLAHHLATKTQPIPAGQVGASAI